MLKIKTIKMTLAVFTISGVLMIRECYSTEITFTNDEIHDQTHNEDHEENHTIMHKDDDEHEDTHNDNHDDHDDEVTEIKLSKEALLGYGIQSEKVEKDMVVQLPISAVIFSKDEHFIYSKEGNEFSEFEVHPEEITEDTISFLNNTGKDEFVVNGAKYLRMVFLNNKNPSSGHAH